jgi:Patatin-like phospholipase
MLTPQSFVRWLAALYFFRVPVLMSAILVLLFWNRANAMVSGLYVGDYKQCFELSFVLTVVAGQTLMLIHLLERHRSKRLGASSVDEPVVEGAGANRFGVPAWLLALIPWFLNGYALYEANHPFPSFQFKFGYVTGLFQSIRLGLGYVAALTGGALLGAGIMLWLYRVDHPATGSRRHSAFTDRFSRMLAKVIVRLDVDNGIGLVEDGRLRDNLLDATLFAVLTLVTYLSFAWITTAALLYVLLWLSLAGWTFGFLCFWFDRYRVPVVTAALIWAVAVTNLPRNEHYYFLMPGQSGTQPAVPSDLFKGPDGKLLPRVVIVSAEGGGIHAAAWTARVLGSLSKRLDKDYHFVDSIRLLSGASGGSVGMMFFQTLYDAPSRPVNPDCVDDVIFESRNGMGLDDIAHAIVYHDIRRPLFPYVWYSKVDRGNSLERAWSDMLDQIGKIKGQPHTECQVASARSKQTIDGLGPAAHAGARPLLIFNATLADSGWPMAVANFQLNEDDGIRVFHERHQKDLMLTTAVRLSASFPYVVPSPRPIICAHPGACLVRDAQPKQDLAVIDGGLYDNYGISAAYQALSQATAGFTHYPAPVLWLQIRAGPSDDEDPTHDKPNPLASGAAGPLYSLYKVRGTGQAKRVNGLTDDAYSQSNRMLTVIPIEYPDPDNQQPLSWKLTSGQANNIDSAWFGRYVNQQKSPGVVDRIAPQVEAFFKVQ